MLLPNQDEKGTKNQDRWIRIHANIKENVDFTQFYLGNKTETRLRNNRTSLKLKLPEPIYVSNDLEVN